MYGCVYLCMYAYACVCKCFVCVSRVAYDCLWFCVVSWFRECLYVCVCVCALVYDCLGVSVFVHDCVVLCMFVHVGV